MGKLSEHMAVKCWSNESRLLLNKIPTVAPARSYTVKADCNTHTETHEREASVWIRVGRGRGRLLLCRRECL